MYTNNRYIQIKTVTLCTKSWVSNHTRALACKTNVASDWDALLCQTKSEGQPRQDLKLRKVFSQTCEQKDKTSSFFLYSSQTPRATHTAEGKKLDQATPCKVNSYLFLADRNKSKFFEPAYQINAGPNFKHEGPNFMTWLTVVDQPLLLTPPTSVLTVHVFMGEWGIFAYANLYFTSLETVYSWS